VARRLLAEGHAVAVWLRGSSNAWRLADILERLTRVEGDLAAPLESLGQARAFGPDVVVHLAWSGVASAHRDDRGQLANLAATVATVDLAAEAGARAWVGLGSQAEYGPTEGRIRENAPTRPTTLYGIAKLSSGLFAAKLCDQLGLRSAWIRLFSTYGPGDDPAWMVPYLINRLLAGERPALTPGTQLWDYLYVDDAARAIAAVATSATAAGVFNLGSGQPRTIRSIVEAIRDAIDPALPLGFGEVPFRPDQVMHLEADIDRLGQATGWTPEIMLEEGIRRTIAWHRSRADAEVVAT
jgi:nucleoside-diphosphate-sugar epimerase